ncbi:unnamed protein product, partial [Brenthis ino]
MADVKWSVKGKVILVTGGAAGIGAGLVRGLLTQNASHVAFLDILEREGESLEGELLNNFGALKAKFIKCDVSNDEQLTRAYQQVIDKYKRLDAVINNAAVIGVADGIHQKTVDVNLTATINSTLKALELMSVDNGGGGGIVINVSSVEALQHKSPPVYSATKLAVLQFSTQIAASNEEKYANTGVRIITVCLGPTDTALLHRHNYIKEKNVAMEISNRQRVTSAVAGIIGVINSGSNGSTWIIAGDKPPADATGDVREAFQIISKATNFV